MDKYKYISTQLARTKNKKHEQYVLTRIIHGLNRDDIKFVTQQHVRTKNGRSLTDLFFPSLSLHIEVDEEYHKKQKEHDAIREADIIDATGHEIIRIPVGGSLSDFNSIIDNCINYIEDKIKDMGDDFIAWSGDVTTANITTGYIDISENISFRKVVDICNHFGYQYKGYQRGGVKHLFDEETIIWWPCLFENDNWKNSISDDEMFIFEQRKSSDKVKVEEHFYRYINGDERTKRIVFAKAKDSLGMILYRFKGLYELSPEKSDITKGLCWERIGTKVKTYTHDSE